MRVVVCVAVATFAVVIASCGGSDAGGGASTFDTSTTLSDAGSGVAALGDAFGALLWEGRSEGPAPFDFSEESAGCVGRSFVGTLAGKVGYENLVDAGVTVEALEQGTANLISIIDNDEFDLLLLGAFEECTDFVRQMATEVGRNAGWSEQSVTCFFDGLLADDESRKVVAWGIFTSGNLGEALFERIGLGGLIDQWFACLTDAELTGLLVVLVDPGIGFGEQSLTCLVGGLLAKEPSREAFKQSFHTDDNLEAMLKTLASNTTTAESVDQLVRSCFSDEEQATIGR
jgi:hypothetical protein